LSESRKDLFIYGTVKVGERGQIVIPAKARMEFNIKPGDLLLVMAGRKKRGLAIVKTDAMREFAQRILEGLGKLEEEK
jgi:AbrB family looped-hinge helix DNA binding protein